MRHCLQNPSSAVRECAKGRTLASRTHAAQAVHTLTHARMLALAPTPTPGAQHDPRQVLLQAFARFDAPCAALCQGGLGRAQGPWRWGLSVAWARGAGEYGAHGRHGGAWGRHDAAHVLRAHGTFDVCSFFLGIAVGWVVERLHACAVRGASSVFGAECSIEYKLVHFGSRPVVSPPP